MFQNFCVVFSITHFFGPNNAALFSKNLRWVIMTRHHFFDREWKKTSTYIAYRTWILFYFGLTDCYATFLLQRRTTSMWTYTKIWVVRYVFRSNKQLSKIKLRSEKPNTLNRGAKRSNWTSLLISHPTLLFGKLQRTIFISLLVGSVQYKYYWKSYKTCHLDLWAQNYVQSSQIHRTEAPNARIHCHI